jgi:hypothetical protein
MVTNKALTELKCWANAAHDGRGDEARLHLQQFIHIGTGFVASNEFNERYREIHGTPFDPLDFERTCKLLDTIANIEVRQVQSDGVTADSSPIGASATS